jgi:hypothetical protein
MAKTKSWGAVGPKTGDKNKKRSRERRKKKVRSDGSHWEARTRKNSKASERAPVPPERKEWTGTGDIALVAVDDVIVPEGMPVPDPLLVVEIAESIQILGLIHPIAVRERLTGFGTKSEKILVAGGTRLAAYKSLGEATVPCTYFPDDKAASELVRLSENLFRKHMTVLEEADEIAKLVELMKAQQIGLFGQNDQNQGRPLSDAGKAARQLPIKAKTIEGRRKKIERAIKISIGTIWHKKLIKEKHLDNNQAALLEIVGGPEVYDQYKIIQRLSRRRAAPRIDSLKERIQETMPFVEQVQYKELLAAWNESPKFKQGWRRAINEHRERFINEILRASDYDGNTAIALVLAALAGRRKVLVQDMHRLGAKRGFSKRTIRKVILGLAIKKKRLSQNPHDAARSP